MNMDVVAVDVSTFRVYDFLRDGETEDELLIRAGEYRSSVIDRLEDICANSDKDADYFRSRLKAERKVVYKIMSWDEFSQAKRAYMLTGEMGKVKEIDKDTYESQLDVLPPLYYVTIDGITMFCMSEMLDGTYTSQYGKVGGKYYTKLVDSADMNTWLHVALKEEGFL